jgi:arylsulfatase A-like enzyme
MRHAPARGTHVEMLLLPLLVAGQLFIASPPWSVEPLPDRQDPRPNILVIVTDDQPPADETLGVMPTVRRLFVDEGRSFPNAVVTTPLCCPSRSSIFTGRYAHNTGVLTNGDEAAVLALDQRTTIQAYLHDQGYDTAIVGKFFNTWPLSKDPPNFDRWATLSGGYQDPVMNVDGSVHRVDGYSTTVLGQQAVGILDDFDAVDDAAPWFIYVAPHAPHGPYEADAMYADAPVPPWKPNPAFHERNISDKPPWIRWRSFTRAQQNEIRAEQLRTLMSVDDMVGTVMDEVDRLGESNTLAVYMSDNGLLWGEHHIGDSKRFPYTASVGVPKLLRWPDHIVAGSTDARLAANIDLAPTIQDAVDGPESPLLRPDGRSLLSDDRHRRLLLEYWRSPDSPVVPSWSGIYRERWLFVEWRDDDGTVTFREYYDLRRDPFELRNLLGDRDPGNDPDVVSLSRQLDMLRTCRTTTCP